MIIGNRLVDHIVYCVHDLERAIRKFEALLGVAPVFGGFHTTQGTKNALLHLGSQCYLEFLAIDKENIDFHGSHWMGIDMLSTPQITRWSLKSDNLDSDSKIIRSYNEAMGRIEGGQRKTTNGEMLKWGMSMPLSEPEIEVIPFMTDWSGSNVHPTDSLEPICRVMDISLSHPDPKAIASVLQQLSVDIDVSHSEIPRISINVDCPNGIVEI